ncbi:heterocyst differentiation protein [Trichormus variabilis ATCC 29413]|uniref:Heterocyst differentiation protein n=2 Tax=Anabaena variabilis TaxID=264691 RepID=Q3M7A4_TRIV2|nr:MULTISPECIES: cell division protein HetF [Nostocaceae]ABA23132.1 heterocyst differentiation protein [Trichormus variabilis ATCC 29413]MBC1214813.1 CHAT domain-containing protein [Trichormus variabilis ARAD]MBC1254177.1 CHAT domain-containing protein [Trichormus variabilis V5]MBC1267253.1 CHAT domain-containing protein [Trichormus variabilis FSR]MBC1303233.1 CHAT domain-containing protein [Trichormus variabilis N2B]
MSQEFHISVTPVGQNDYLVRTEEVAPGVPLAEELVTWPVADWLAAAGHLMNDPLKSVLQGDAFLSMGRESAIARNSVNLVALGQQLYNALFQGTLRDSLITAQGIAQNHQQVLRLRLGLKDTRLARLPWEVMHAGDRPLATGPYIAFSRYQSGISPTSRVPSANRLKLPEDGVVRVLMILASPTDQASLDLLKQESIRLQAELHRQLPRSIEGGNYLPEIDLTLLNQPGREEVTQALEQGRYHVLHYSGHSNLGPNGGEIYLVSSRTGLTETLCGDDLAGLLVNNNIQMAVFNSCWGTYTASFDNSGDTGERNLTDSLVKRGIQSVLAMSERIPDEVALTLTQLFYRNLSQGYPVDLCVSRVRQGLISAYGSHQLYWALPILYLQPEFDGFLSPKLSAATSVGSLDEYSSSLAANTASTYSGVLDDGEMSLPIEDMMPSGLVHDSSGVDWLGEETWGDLVDEIEYDDPSYAEDSAFVSDIFRQLDQQIIGDEETEVPPEVRQPLPDSHLERPIATAPREDFSRIVPPATHHTAQNLNQDLENFRLLASRNRVRRQRWQIFGMIGVGAIAIILIFSWWQSRQTSVVRDIPPIPTPSLPVETQPPTDLRQMPTGMVTAIATEKLNQGDLEPGLAAVEELLNRNALQPAQTALQLIPANQEKQASVNFLRGRLAWQSIQTGDKKYSIDDARRYWERAVKANPKSLSYINALGFAYYAEGNINRANNSWFQAISLGLKQVNTADAAEVSPKADVPIEALPAYAGLALGMYKNARNRNFPPDKQAQYINEALKLRQTVLEKDPINFQLDELSKNWLWTENSLRDWRSLLQQKSPKQSRGR